VVIAVVRRWWMVAVVLWAAAVIPGFAWLEHYANAPGRIADPPATWPTDLPLERHADRYTLALLAHPDCPCTRATLDELSRLMAQVNGRVDAYVLFVDVAGDEHTDLWTRAEAIPGVRALSDRSSAISRELGAYTSGQVLLYDPSGRLVFNGGITPARGHEGDNTGESAIAELIHGGSVPVATSNVFGCALDAHERQQ